MKKEICVILLFIILAGCVSVSKRTSIQIEGDDVSAPIGPLQTVKGKNLKLTIIREVISNSCQKQP